jgi:hypothetical protein
LSSFAKYEIFVTPCFLQSSADSSSLGASLSHSNTVTAIFLGSTQSQSLLVKNSYDQAIDSALK